jgi:MFS family permease
MALPISSTMPPTNVRHRVVTMAVLLAMVTYLDRTSISTMSADIQRDLKISKDQMGWVFSAFSLAYAAFEIPTAWWARAHRHPGGAYAHRVLVVGIHDGNGVDDQLPSDAGNAVPLRNG